MMTRDQYINIARGNGKSGLSWEPVLLNYPGHPEVNVTVDPQGNRVHMSLDFYGYDNYATFANFYAKGKLEAKLEVDHHLNRINYIHYALDALPPIKKVIFNEPATIVLWGDSTKTVVKCQEGDVYDPEKGLYACIVKKVLGNKSNFNNVINKLMAEYKEEK